MGDAARGCGNDNGVPAGPDGLRPGDLEDIARIHCAVLPDGFLAELGPRALYHIYAGAATAPGSIWLVRRHQAKIAGFLLATVDTRALFRHIVVRRGIPMVPALLRAGCRRLGLITRMIESLRYPATLEARPDPAGHAELVAIGIRPECRSNGYGTELVQALEGVFARRGVRRYTVAVYSSNHQANAFYQRHGFELMGEFRLYGTRWTRYERRLSQARTTAG
jgi:ribosomal protein S18 acetylase RimI-like enzyme